MSDLPFTASNLTSSSYNYVHSLATCTFYFVSSTCAGNAQYCPSYDPSGQSDILQQCNIAALGASSIASANAAASDPCAADSIPEYDQGLHIAAVFIILISSLIGSASPLISKYHPGFNVDPFVFCIGKCLGIGILLACALVHMLQPASQELTAPCLGWEFDVDYNAYAFLFCMLAIIFMHFIDFVVEEYMTQQHIRIHEEKEKLERQIKQRNNRTEDNVVVKTVEMTPPADHDDSASIDSPSIDFHYDDSEQGHPRRISTVIMNTEHSDNDHDKHTHKPIDKHSHGHSHQNGHHHHHHHDKLTKSPATGPDVVCDDHVVPSAGHLAHDDHLEHNHVHSILLAKGIKKTIAAYLLEFGVTVHSVFIGLTTGIVGVDQLDTLLVALVFHQMFEGIALGARIADADLSSHMEEFLMVLIFSISAPIGLAIGVGVTSSLNPNGATYNYTAGTFDGICSGILLYIGLMLLLKDFPADMKKFCHKSITKKCLMFMALWTGAGVMGFIGKYL